MNYDMEIVYLLCELGSDPERYKIGVTKDDPRKRIKQLQTGCPNEIALIRTFESRFYRKIEGTLHREYARYATSGGTEWFELPTDIVFGFVDRCTQLHETFKMLEESENPFF